jgi:hypothetical protein
VLVLAVSPVLAAQGGPGTANVVTQNDLPSECLAPVAINRIDGEIRALSARGFTIEAGIHAINGRATLDTRKCQPLVGDQQIGTTPDLELNFEAGRIYYIAYDRSSPNTDDWQLVVWKVEYPRPMIDYIQSSDTIQ